MVDSVHWNYLFTLYDKVMNALSVKLNKYHKEMIVDAPFMRLIITPMSSLQREKHIYAKDPSPPPEPGASG